MMLNVSEAWRAAYPEAAVGILALKNVANPKDHAALNRHKKQLEERLRARFAGSDRAALKALPTIEAYNAYYKGFKKTYHVLLQLESVALKGKPIPRVSALVEAMFMAELKNQLLTAGHDLAVVQAPIKLDVAKDDERYVGLDGRERRTKAGDMIISDAQGIISSVIYGPDQRTRIRPETQQVLFTVYAPAGIGEPAVTDHLQDIQANIVLFAPEAEVEVLRVFSSS